MRNVSNFQGLVLPQKTTRSLWQLRPSHLIHLMECTLHSLLGNIPLWSSVFLSLCSTSSPFLLLWFLWEKLDLTCFPHTVLTTFDDPFASCWFCVIILFFPLLLNARRPYSVYFLVTASAALHCCPCCTASALHMYYMYTLYKNLSLLRNRALIFIQFAAPKRIIDSRL